MFVDQLHQLSIRQMERNYLDVQNTYFTCSRIKLISDVNLVMKETVLKGLFIFTLIYYSILLRILRTY